MEPRTHISARVVADSIHKGQRLISVLTTYPLFIHAEVLRHRNFVSSVQSNRAVSLKRNIEFLYNRGPVLPLIGGTQSGMVDSGELGTDKRCEIYGQIEESCFQAIHSAKQMHAAGLHHSYCNRYLAPFLPCAHLLTGLEIWWEDFFAQRIKADVERNCRALAVECRNAIAFSEPANTLNHIPFESEIRDSGINEQTDVMVSSVARCARVSYANYAKQKPIDEEYAFVSKLWNAKHVSPFEHVAFAQDLEGLSMYSRRVFGDKWLSFRHYHFNSNMVLLKLLELKFLQLPNSDFNSNMVLLKPLKSS